MCYDRSQGMYALQARFIKMMNLRFRSFDSGRAILKPPRNSDLSREPGANEFTSTRAYRVRPTPLHRSSLFKTALWNDAILSRRFIVSHYKLLAMQCKFPLGNLFHFDSLCIPLLRKRHPLSATRNECYLDRAAKITKPIATRVANHAAASFS